MGEIELGAAAEATIMAYKELASDPGKRLALALDRTCIQFLAYVVAEGEGSLVKAAIETLSLIAQAVECRTSLAGTFGVLESLQAVTEDEECYSDELRDQAAALFTSLQYAKFMKKAKSPTTSSGKAAPEEKKTDDVDSTPKQSDDAKAQDGGKEGSPSKSNAGEKADEKESPQSRIDSARSSVGSIGKSVSTDEEYSKSEKKPRPPASSFLGQNNSKAKIVTLYIKGMVAPEHRKQVEEELVRVRGLISIVFDLGRSQVICRVKRDLPIDKLAAAVVRTEIFSAQQVTTNANGEEVKMPLGADPTEVTSPDDDLPDYLSEDDVCVQDETSAMAPSGSFKETATSWLTSAASLLHKSFYW